MTPPTNQFLINARWVIPVEPLGEVLEYHSLLISDNIIQALLPSDVARQQYPDITTINLPHHLVTAGFINAHGHAAMTLFRGYADDLELMDWLNNHIWPAENKLVNYDFVKDGSTLAVAEMISTGTTCAADTYFFPNAVAAAFAENKFRGQVASPIIQFPNAWAKTEEEHIHKGLEFIDSINNHGLLTPALAPHSPYTVTDYGFEQTRIYAEELELPIHLHLHETEQEVTSAVAATGRRPITRMHQLGLLSPALQAIHMTQLEADEIELLSASGVHIAHCPESNMKLASGYCPVDALQKRGVNVAIGTDGAASNNNLDMLEETRSASLLSKLYTADAQSCNAHEALAMATINGAKLLGLDNKTGSLKPGKLADIIALDLSGINFQPVHKPLSQLIYSASGHQVSHTWINGELLYDNGRLTQLDTDRLISVVNEWRDQIGAIV